MTIRDGTKYEEVIGVRREWVYPWRFDLASAYYDIAVMELGKKPVLLCFCTKRKTKFHTSVFLFVQKRTT